LLNKEEIVEYLGFLRSRANELASKERTTEDDLRVINIEVNKFLDRLRESHFENQRFIRDVDALKFSVDEAKNTNRHWLIYAMIYGVLRLLPGMIVVHFKDKSDSKKRKDKLAKFKGQVDQLITDFARSDIYTNI